MLKDWAPKSICNPNNKNEIKLPILLSFSNLIAVFQWQTIGFNDESGYLDAGSHVSALMFIDNLSQAPLNAYWFKMLILLMRTPSTWLYTRALVCIPFFSIWPYVPHAYPAATGLAVYVSPGS